MNDLMTLFLEFVNQPSVKEFIKNFCSSFTFAFGFVHLGMLIIQRKNTKETLLSGAERAVHIAQNCTSLSLILSASCSRPSVYFFTTFCDCCLPTDFFETYFGPNTLFDLNPWHPRHVISLIALALALPSPALSCIHFFRPLSSPPTESSQKTGWMALFNTLTCRPVLHTGNQLGKFIFFRF